ncbi:MAG: phosphotransferase [bacterium]|nr:phosphotransferase [Candidatus Colisoma equi]
MIRKAIVLAAGLGTRLRPLTCAVPKPLMPVWGEPMLARIVGMLRSWGVEDIVVNCHYLHEQVERWCAANGCKASYEPEILGTGGVLNPLRKWIGKDDFYLVNGDVVVENVPDLTSHVSRLVSSADQIGVALVTEEGPRTVEVEPESGFVTNWKSDDAGYSGTFTYCGIACLKAEILNYVEPSGFSSIVQAYEKAMMEGRFVKAVQPKDLLWTDAGTIASYIDLNRDGDDNAFADIPQLKHAGVSKAEFLGARGSDRVFFRADDGIVILYDDEKRGENAKYAGHAKWLKSKGVSVPDVVADYPEMKTTVMAWGGTERKMSLEDYVKVVEHLERFNRLGDAAVADGLSLEPPFDAALYRWERELFAEYCLGANFQMEMPDAVRKELEKVAEILEKEPKALVHRDFQSTNVLWKGNDLTFIDFQGMRLGPAAYDLASLVYDPYVTFTEGERRALVALYAKRAGRPELEKVLPFAAVQRLSQCLGAYGRLKSVGQPQFQKHVVPALRNLLDAADKAGLDAIGALAEDLIAKSQHVHHHDEHCHCHEH